MAKASAGYTMHSISPGRWMAMRSHQSLQQPLHIAILAFPSRPMACIMTLMFISTMREMLAWTRTFPGPHHTGHDCLVTRKKAAPIQPYLSVGVVCKPGRSSTTSLATSAETCSYKSSNWFSTAEKMYLMLTCKLAAEMSLICAQSSIHAVVFLNMSSHTCRIRMVRRQDSCAEPGSPASGR